MARRKGGKRRKKSGGILASLFGFGLVTGMPRGRRRRPLPTKVGALSRLCR